MENAEFDRLQKLVNQQKEKVYNKEMRSEDFYAYIAGVLTSELSYFFNKKLNTSLDLEKVPKY